MGPRPASTSPTAGVLRQRRPRGSPTASSAATAAAAAAVSTQHLDQPQSRPESVDVSDSLSESDNSSTSSNSTHSSTSASSGDNPGGVVTVSSASPTDSLQQQQQCQQDLHSSCQSSSAQLDGALGSSNDDCNSLLRHASHHEYHQFQHDDDSAAATLKRLVQARLAAAHYVPPRVPYRKPAPSVGICGWLARCMGAVVLFVAALVLFSLAQQSVTAPKLAVSTPTAIVNNLCSIIPGFLWRPMIGDAEVVKGRALSLMGHMSTDFMFEFDDAESRVVDLFEYAHENLSPVGQLFASSLSSLLLSNRLQTSALLAHPTIGPAIHAQVVRAPIIVVGMPRSGTTAMHRMLATLTDTRPLYMYEALFPAGFPGSYPEQLKPNQADPRLAPAHWFDVAHSQFSSRALREVHSTESDEPEECFLLTMHAFEDHPLGILASSLGWQAPTTNYNASNAYRYRWHKMLLQTQQWIKADARRWCLKAPLHLSGIAQLLRTYPDAHVVWMHRDPVHVVTSYANLKATATASTMGSHRWNQDNVTRVGPEVMDMLHSVLTDALKDRDSLPQEVQQRAFVDVTYHDFVADPAGVSCRIARHVGIACDEAELRRTADRHKHRRSQARFESSEFGIDTSEVARLFGDYAQRFGLPIDGPRHYRRGEAAATTTTTTTTSSATASGTTAQ